MKIISMGDSPHTISGFATALRYLDTYLHNVGHVVEHIGFQSYGQDMVASFQDQILGYPLLPNIGGKRFGDDAWKFWLPQKQPDVFLTLADFWMLIEVFKQDVEYPWCHWYPIDGYPITNQLKEMLKKIDYRVCMSQFGRDLVKAEGFKTHYIPHGVDTAVYRPRSPNENKETKASLGVGPNTFLIGCFGRNQTRKKHPRAIQIFKKVKEMFPEVDMALLMWMDKRDFEGWDLQFICERYELKIGQDVIFPPPTMMPNFMYGVTSEQLAKIMAACDLHLFPTGGEGFGLTGLETMSCGTVNVATNYTTPPEIFQFGKKGQCGLPIEVETFDMGNAGVDRALVSVDHGASQIKWFLENPDEAISMSKKGVARAKRYYDWGVVVESFDKFLRDVVK